MPKCVGDFFLGRVKRMHCLPRCDVPLPEIGQARVLSHFDFCRQPPELTLTLIHEVRSTSTFVLRKDNSMDSRRVGTEHWPMRLSVLFEREEGGKREEGEEMRYRVQACVLTERLDRQSCFMNATVTSSEVAGGQVCGAGGAAAAVIGSATSAPAAALGLLLFFLMITVGVVVGYGMRQLYRMIVGGSGRRTRIHKQSQCASLLPAMHHHKWESERLTVIEEEKEESHAHLTPSNSIGNLDRGTAWSANFSSPATVSTVISPDRRLFPTFKPPAQQV